MRELISIIVCLMCAFGFGFFIARGSAKREKIYGGQWAIVFHYIGASAFTGLLPGVLCSVVLGVGSVLIIPFFLSLMSLTFASLVLFALVEYPARNQALRQRQERGWTEKDARTSGL